MQIARFAALFLGFFLPALAMADSADRAFRTAFANLPVPQGMAMAAGFVRANGPPVVLATGPRYRGARQQVESGARWHIGSISKSFTATLLMRLAESGAIDFDAPLAELLAEYADEMHADWRALTLGEILSHTAGLPANFTRAEMTAPVEDDLTRARLVRLRGHWSAPLPGTTGRFDYSNLGYVLAGFIAETRAGQPWQQLVRREIAAPLGLTSLGFGAPAGAQDPWGHTFRLFHYAPVAPDDPDSDNPAWLGPAGTLHMSMGDLLKWGQTHLRACRGDMPEFLSAPACRRLHSPVTRNYALGWVVTHEPWLGDGLVQSHDGSNTLWIAELAYSQSEGVVLAVILNQERNRLARRAIATLGAALTEAR